MVHLRAATAGLAEDMADRGVWAFVYCQSGFAERFRSDAPLNALEEATLYGGAKRDIPIIRDGRLVER